MDCLFCKIINGDIPSYTLYEDDDVLCFLDINPLSKGHTLVIPKKHYKDINDIPLEELNSINDASKKIVKLLTNTYKPNGIKLIQNNGSVQEIKHYHLHIIPVYNRNKKVEVSVVYNELKKNC